MFGEFRQKPLFCPAWVGKGNVLVSAPPRRPWCARTDNCTRCLSSARPMRSEAAPVRSQRYLPSPVATPSFPIIKPYRRRVAGGVCINDDHWWRISGNDRLLPFFSLLRHNQTSEQRLPPPHHHPAHPLETHKQGELKFEHLFINKRRFSQLLCFLLSLASLA